MQAMYDVATEKLTVVGDHNEGQPRQWLITVRMQRSDGSRFKRSWKSKGKRTIHQLMPDIQTEMLIDHLEDSGVMFLGFIAIAR